MATRAEIKSKFETGDKPTQADFYSWIESDFNLTDDTTDDLTEGNSKFVSQAEKDKLSGIEEGATVGADWETNISNKPTTISQSQADEIAIYAKSRAFATLTDATAQNIDIDDNHNAKCEVELSGNTTFTLTNLDIICQGIIDISALTTQRTITIAAQKGDTTPITVKYSQGEAIATEDTLDTSIAWEYNGSYVNVVVGKFKTL